MAVYRVRELEAKQREWADKHPGGQQMDEASIKEMERLRRLVDELQVRPVVYIKLIDAVGRW